METDRILDLLAKCLELADSDIDGEALSAARKANNLRQKLGKSWGDILSQDASSPTDTKSQDTDTKPFSVHTELSRLHMRVAELQADFDHAQSQKNLLEEEKQLLRASLEEAHADAQRRESDLRAQMRDFIDQLTLEQNHVQKISETLTNFQDQKQTLQKQNFDLEKRLHNLACRNQVLKEVIQEITDREILLRSRLKNFETDEFMDLEESAFSWNIPTLETPALEKKDLTFSQMSPDTTAGLPAPEIKLNRLLPALPIFDTQNSDTATYIVEVKPLSKLVTDATLKHAITAYTNARQSGAEYIVASPSGITLGSLFEMDIDPAIAASLIAAIDASDTLTWSDYTPIRDRFNLKMVQIAAVVLQNDLRYIRQPWQLKRLPKGQSHKLLRGIR